MKVLLAIPLTILFYFVFVFLLVFFHFIQLVVYHLGGYEAHKRSVDLLNVCLLQSLKILGTKISVSGLENLPENRSIIVASNHQSMMDIPPIIWLLRAHHMKFIAKKELSRGVPSISFNLQKGGSLLIDRKKGKETKVQMMEYASKLAEKGHSVCIFPEGTRSRTGKLKEFKAGGLVSLVTASPGTPVVPFLVDGNYKIFQDGFFPLNIGQTVNYQVLPPILSGEVQPEMIASLVRSRIENALPY
ncbi:MAG: 1-acyl-sn-glycerol-3-phosphate acyltransferase [Cyclobacteriaceae bacterium]|jgi:1-acyl-sn-glycerol-3-phosphate acyltransferase